MADLRTVHIELLCFRTELMNEFMNSAKENHNSAQAVQLVQLAHALSLAICEPLTQKVLAEFDVSKEQK